MKHLLFTLLFVIAGMTCQAQITFTSDSTFISVDTSWVQLDTISVGNKTWYQISQVQFDRSGNRAVNSYPPMTKARMREYARQGRDQTKQRMEQKRVDLNAEKAQMDVYSTILDALSK